jgi:hypothetical protein
MVSDSVLVVSVVFKIIAMISGICGNVTVLIYIIFLRREKTATSYLVAHLALVDLLLCVTFYPMWIIEFIQALLNIDSDQELFCKLSRSSIWALLFVSVATLLIITIDRYLYIVKPLKYPFMMTNRRVFLAILGTWTAAFGLFVAFLINFTNDPSGYRSLCALTQINIAHFVRVFMFYVPISFILVLNVWILLVARKQRQRILAQTQIIGANGSRNESDKKISYVHGFFHTLKAVKTFLIVVIVLSLCVFVPALVGLALGLSCSLSCRQMWYVIFEYEFYGINSIVNAFIYGMRHFSYRKVCERIVFKLFPRCLRGK